MSVHEEVTQAVSAAIHNPMAAREGKENVFDLYTRLASDALGPFIDDLERARASHVRLMAELDRLREHSTWLNAICWKITEALGDVPNGAGQIDGNPVDLADRLCAEVERLRAAEVQKCADDMYRDAYRAINKLMDKAHGSEESDGAGAGLLEDVALVVSQRDDARAKLAACIDELERLRFGHARLLAAEGWVEGARQSRAERAQAAAVQAEEVSNGD